MIGLLGSGLPTYVLKLSFQRELDDICVCFDAFTYLDILLQYFVPIYVTNYHQSSNSANSRDVMIF